MDPIDIIKTAEGVERRIRNNLAALEDLAPKIKRLQAILRPISRFVRLKFIALTDPPKLIIGMPVKSFEDVGPLLEEVAEGMGVEFDGTRDEALAGWREYTCSKTPWLRVDAEIIDNGAPGGCRKVIVGYEQQPVYELRCGEDAPVATNAPVAPDGEAF